MKTILKRFSRLSGSNKRRAAREMYRQGEGEEEEREQHRNSLAFEHGQQPPAERAKMTAEQGKGEGEEAKAEKRMKTDEENQQQQKEEDALIAAVFQQIQLPEVRFASSPVASPSPITTPAPPNSVRTQRNAEEGGEGAMAAETTPRTPRSPPRRRRPLAGRKQTPREKGEEEQDGEEADEQQTTHLLLVHGDNISLGQIQLEEDQQPGMMEWAEEEEEEGRRSTPSREHTLGSPSTGEGCVDSVRSVTATFGDYTTTPRKSAEGEDEEWEAEEEGGGEGQEGGGEEEKGEERGEQQEEGTSRMSSQMSRELVGSALANALQHCGEGEERQDDDGDDRYLEDEDEEEREKGAGETMAEPEEGMRDKEEGNNNNDDDGDDDNEARGGGEGAAGFLEAEFTRVREKTVFQTELDRRVGQRLSQLTTAGGSASSRSSSPPREVHVRTVLNDPESPMTVKGFSPFEPEKQELIRREIGSAGPEGIRRMVDRFQSGRPQPREEETVENGRWRKEEGRPKDRGGGRASMHGRQKSAHFQLQGLERAPRDTDMEDRQQQPPKRKNTPHPVQRQQSAQPENASGAEASPRTAIVVESQRPVADIRNKFQSSEFQHPTGANGGGPKTAAARDKEESSCGGTVAGRAPSTFGIGSPSVWSGKNAQPARDPAPGSLAAIRKSLTMGSVPGTPPMTNGGSAQQTTGENDGTKVGRGPSAGEKESKANSGMHGREGVMPKNVSQFYRLWGSAQAQSAANGGGKQPAQLNGGKTIANGNGTTAVVAQR